MCMCVYVNNRLFVCMRLYVRVCTYNIQVHVVEFPKATTTQQPHKIQGTCTPWRGHALTPCHHRKLAFQKPEPTAYYPPYPLSFFHHISSPGLCHTNLIHIYAHHKHKHVHSYMHPYQYIRTSTRTGCRCTRWRAVSGARRWYLPTGLVKTSK